MPHLLTDVAIAPDAAIALYLMIVSSMDKVSDLLTDAAIALHLMMVFSMDKVSDLLTYAAIALLPHVSVKHGQGA